MYVITEGGDAVNLDRANGVSVGSLVVNGEVGVVAHFAIDGFSDFITIARVPQTHAKEFIRMLLSFATTRSGPNFSFVDAAHVIQRLKGTIHAEQAIKAEEDRLAEIFEGVKQEALLDNARQA